MAYADPLTITVDSVAYNLPRVFSATGPSTFKTGDDEFQIEISHANVKGRRERHLIRLSQTKYVSDPLVPANNISAKASVYLVLDNPTYGLNDTKITDLVTSFVTFIGNAGNMAKFIGGEA